MEMERAQQFLASRERMIQCGGAPAPVKLKPKTSDRSASDLDDSFDDWIEDNLVFF